MLLRATLSEYNFEKQYTKAMILSKENLDSIRSENLIKPSAAIFELPIKVLQFGTGVLLRGLPDYFIDKANREGVFNGRVAVVKSTGNNTAEFDEQDSLYTLCIRGLENGQPVSKNIISSAISQVIAANNNWESVLKLAQSEDLRVIVSNTTEVGIQLLSEKIDQNPPSSFPAKVLAVLYHRYQKLGAKNTGLIIIATELIPDNGKKLASIVLELANYNKLDQQFIAWLTNQNTFCNSLVDRIVPGKPDADSLKKLEDELGYKDNLLSMAEPYSLWAIEGNDKVRDVLSFAKVDKGVIIADDIEVYRELKVRLLNGTHTLSSGIAFLAGIDTVKNAMKNETLKSYIDELMAQEIGPAIPYQVTERQTTSFANTVKDRFANPAIEHLWLNITFQYSMKMKIRILPLLLNHYKKFNSVPENIAFGFAAYLRFLKVDKKEGDKYFGKYKDINYIITDDEVDYFQQQSQTADYVTNVLEDVDFWKADLNLLLGFIDSVKHNFDAIESQGVLIALKQIASTKINIA